MSKISEVSRLPLKYGVGVNTTSEYIMSSEFIIKHIVKINSNQFNGKSLMLRFAISYHFSFHIFCFYQRKNRSLFCPLVASDQEPGAS